MSLRRSRNGGYGLVKPEITAFENNPRARSFLTQIQLHALFQKTLNKLVKANKAPILISKTVKIHPVDTPIWVYQRL
jgi:hypothetical protein